MEYSSKHMQKTAFNRNQNGFVSILVTMIMMIVITLIVLGFVQVTTRNQREALDRQLSTQAYYAAETGVNDAISAMKATSYSYDPSYSTNCGAFSAAPANASYNPIINSAGNVAYTCLLINPFPTTQVATDVAANSNIVWTLTNTNAGVPLKTVTYKWTIPSSITPASNGTCTAAVGTYTPANSYACNLAVLRVDLVQASGSSLGDANSLTQAQQTIYMQPINTGSGAITIPVDFSGAAVTKGNIASCKPDAATYSCQVVITLPASAASSYYTRVVPLYKDAGSVTVSATDASGPVQFSQGQVVIDSTGKAQDELRRLQVRVQLNGSSTSNLPAYSLQTTGAICKYFTYSPTDIPSNLGC